MNSICEFYDLYDDSIKIIMVKHEKTKVQTKTRPMTKLDFCFFQLLMNVMDFRDSGLTFLYN